MSMFLSGVGYEFRPYGIQISIIVSVLFLTAILNDAQASISNHTHSVVLNVSAVQPDAYRANVLQVPTANIFILPRHEIRSADASGTSGSSDSVALIRVAQVNFDFTGFGSSSRRRVRRVKKRAKVRAPKVKVYRAQKRRIVRVKPKPSGGLFGFFGSKPKVQTTSLYSAQGYYRLRGPDGRAYLVYPNGKRKLRPGAFGLDNAFKKAAKRPSGYRTMCVRTCDGYYFPVSNGTRKSRLRRDNNTCASSCAVPAKLFYYSNAGGSVDTMVDLKGKKYSSMKYAYKYRKKSVNSCRCKEQPWALSEIIRHEQYAADEKDRGVRYTRLVKVAHVKVASVKVDMTDSYNPEIYYNGSGNVTKSVSDTASAKPAAAVAGGKIENKKADIEYTAFDLSDVTAPAPVGDTDTVASVDGSITDFSDDATAENAGDSPYVRTVANSRTAIKRLKARRRSRKRYRMSARRMKQWWRSNRY